MIEPERASSQSSSVPLICQVSLAAVEILCVTTIPPARSKPDEHNQRRMIWHPANGADATRRCYRLNAGTFEKHATVRHGGRWEPAEDTMSAMTAKISSNGATCFVWDSSAPPLTVTNLTEFHEGKAASAAIRMQGNDTITGGLTENDLEGYAGDDTIDGGTDKLVGGLGKDTLIGGDDGDRFIFRSVEESKVKISGRDIIEDFSRKDHDEIDLRGIDANERKPKDQDFTFIGHDDFHKKVGELRYEKFIDGVVVLGDADGNGGADFSVEMHGLLSLKAGDFLL
jgi:hypothetical protein